MTDDAMTTHMFGDTPREGDLHIEPISDVRVGSLVATCGMCGQDIEIEDRALDHETGRVDGAYDFQECPECGNLHDAQSATFSAYIVAEGADLHRPTPAQNAASDLQPRVLPWLIACFGETVAHDREERADRLVEELFELLQSGGYDPNRIIALRDYVWARPIGEPAQEVGGTMLTLAAYCIAHGLDMHAAGDAELARVWGKVDVIRAKQAAKPKGSALPQAWPAAPTETDTVALRLAQWMVSRDTGASAKTIAAVMIGAQPTTLYAPGDESDLGRCMRLLGRFPEWKPRMTEMRSVSPSWALIAPHWERMATEWEAGRPGAAADILKDLYWQGGAE